MKRLLDFVSSVRIGIFAIRPVAERSPAMLAYRKDEWVIFGGVGTGGSRG